MAYWRTKFFESVIMLTPELVQLLACPICKGELSQSKDGSFLHCQPCGRDYPVIEGIPVLLP